MVAVVQEDLLPLMRVRDLADVNTWALRLRVYLSGFLVKGLISV